MKTEPLDYQIPVIEKIKNKDSFALFMEYGTGKSYIILYWIYHNLKKLKGPVLIVGKKTNIIEGNAWTTEINTHTYLPYRTLTGTKEQKLNVLHNNTLLPVIYLINYESLKHMEKELIEKKFSVIVFDESTSIKNPKAKVTKTAIKLSKQIPHRIIATGFPVSEHLDELWSQYFVIDQGNILESSYWKFMNKYFYRWRFGWSIKKNKDKEIINKIQHNCVFIKLKNCLKLPPKTNKYIALDPTKRQLRYMDKLKHDFSLDFKNKKLSLEFKHVLPVLTKSQQICSGFILFSNSETVKFRTPKSKHILNLCKNILEKKIIWCKYIEETEQIYNLLLRNNLKPLLLSSKDNNVLQASILNNFKNYPNFKILITTYNILNSGETLSSCNYSIHYSYTWSNHITTNAKRRIYRKGSEIHKKINYIYLYIKDSVEEEIIKNLEKKKIMQRKLKEYMENWLW
ncbi:MAG TPA: hypothetical protein ENG87_06015 [Candidatus Pacearchaeota archaeon]|nr:hypothetical protein [Candidatus Pacearchaeota archaeon]